MKVKLEWKNETCKEDYKYRIEKPGAAVRHPKCRVSGKSGLTTPGQALEIINADFLEMDPRRLG